MRSRVTPLRGGGGGDGVSLGRATERRTGFVGVVHRGDDDRVEGLAVLGAVAAVAAGGAVRRGHEALAFPESDGFGRDAVASGEVADAESGVVLHGYERPSRAGVVGSGSGDRGLGGRLTIGGSCAGASPRVVD